MISLIRCTLSWGKRKQPSWDSLTLSEFIVKKEDVERKTSWKLEFENRSELINNRVGIDTASFYHVLICCCCCRSTEVKTIPGFQSDSQLFYWDYLLNRKCRFVVWRGSDLVGRFVFDSFEKIWFHVREHLDQRCIEDLLLFESMALSIGSTHIFVYLLRFGARPHERPFGHFRSSRWAEGTCRGTWWFAAR